MAQKRSTFFTIFWTFALTAAAVLLVLNFTAGEKKIDQQLPRLYSTQDPQFMRAMGARVDDSMPVGNEGAGVVIAAGASPEAQALLGKTVAALGGAMYSQYRTLNVAACLALPEGSSAAEGSSRAITGAFPSTWRARARATATRCA